MSEYDPLREYLANLPSYHREAAFSFKELEVILGKTLPPSAHNHRPWWGNDYSSRTHSHAQAWIRAGWKVDAVNMKEEWVRFVRAGRRKWMQRSMSTMDGR